MALALPPFVVLKLNSNGNYLCPVLRDSQAETYESIQFSGEDVFDLSAKFEVEAADDGLVHIRSCYNNKYWARGSEFDYRIVTQATEQEEDRDKWSCTLFKPTINWDARTVRFHHVQLNRSVSVTSATGCSLYIATTEQGGKDEEESEYTFINWESLLMLPRYVAFKGDNGWYLTIRRIEDHPHVQFTGRNIRDPTTMNEVFVTGNGSVRIKSCDHGKFWRRDSKANWIWADSDDNDPSGNDYLFWPVKIDNKEIALRNKGNGYFCRRLTAKGKTDCLSAAVDGITKEAYLELEEPVISRIITNVKFRPKDGRIHTQNVITLAFDEITNKSPTESQTEELTFLYSKTESSTWSSTVSLKLEVKTTIKAGIPSVLNGQIEISDEHCRSIQWGNMEQRSTVIETKHTVTIPPRTTVNVSVLATKSSFEVPFSYTQLDTLANGNQVTTKYYDGVYQGVNYFGFKHETVQKRLEANAIQN